MKKKLKISKRNNISSDWEVMEDGGYTWSSQKAPTQQVVGSVENVQTSKPSI